MRFRAIGWNRREARGRPRAATFSAAAALALALSLAACSGGDSADEDSETTPSGEAGRVPTGAATEGGDGGAPVDQGSEGWTAYVPLAESGDAEEPSSRHARATCSLTHFRLFLDSERGVSAVLDEAGRVIASATVTTRGIAAACRAATPRFKRYRDDREEPRLVYESGAVRCVARRGIEIETFPILDGRGGVWGSNLVVSLRGRPLAIAGAITVQDAGGRRLYYLSQYCEPL